MEKEFLIETIYETIEDVCTDVPLYAGVKNDNGLALIWYHDENIGSLWEMFDSNIKRNQYFKTLEELFYIEFKKNLYVSYKLHPIVFNNELCSCILLEW